MSTQLGVTRTRIQRLVDERETVNKLHEDVELAADSAAADKYDDAGQRLIAVVGSLARALAADAE